MVIKSKNEYIRYFLMELTDKLSGLLNRYSSRREYRKELAARHPKRPMFPRIAKALAPLELYAPQWDIQPSNLTFDEGQTAYTANLDNLTSDLNLDERTYSLKHLPSGFSWNLDNGIIGITPDDPDYNGTLDNLILTVSAGEHSKDSDPFSLTYNNINDAPVVADIPDQNLDRGDSVVIDLNPYVTDPDNTDQEMTWSASGYDTDDVTVDISTLSCNAQPSLRSVLGRMTSTSAQLIGPAFMTRTSPDWSSSTSPCSPHS